ncbi:fluoride efflux transporter CrcB [bacterium]|nr:fluoride efflux transporter CrcB [bacterium]MCB2202338.1 fluoride efflux transporter CrcB [bacterium]
MHKLILVGVGGFAGAISRYVLSGLAHRLLGSSFPWGTLAVNLIGCFLIGGLMVFAEDRAVLSPQTRLLLGVGFLGAFTTFSTFGYESLELLRDKQLFYLALNLLVSVVGGLTAVWAGRALARHFFL